jgi:hypothetical protein
MSTKLIDYILFYSLLIITLAPPIYFWIKWIKEAQKNKRRFGRVASILSFTLFISGLCIAWFGPEDPFVHNTIEFTLTGAYLVLHFFFAFTIPIVYFFTRWLLKVLKMILSRNQ